MSQTGGLVVVGVNHHTAPLELRERLAIDVAQWQVAWPAPSVLLATCNRVEVCAWADGRARELAMRLIHTLARASGVAHSELAPHAFVSTGSQAVRHLVRVAAGLDSLVLGDEQIRTQIRSASDRARESGKLPAPLHGCLTRAQEAGRRIRASTLLGAHPSVAEAAVGIACTQVGPRRLGPRTALVLGAGTMAQAATGALLHRGWRVTLLNRTPEHAAKVAESLGANVNSAPLHALTALLTDTDLVVGATASRQPVLGVAAVESALLGRHAPLLIVDIAVPRDVDPLVRSLTNVTLVDMADLESMCPVEFTAREAEIQRAEALAAEEADRISAWLHLRAVVPSIVDLRRQGEHIRALELRRAAPRLRDLTPEQRQAVDAVTGAIVNKLLHGPTVLLREAGVRGRPARSRRMVREVLRLDRTRTIQHCGGTR